MNFKIKRNLIYLKNSKDIFWLIGCRLKFMHPYLTEESAGTVVSEIKKLL